MSFDEAQLHIFNVELTGQFLGLIDLQIGLCKYLKMQSLDL